MTQPRRPTRISALLFLTAFWLACQDSTGAKRDTFDASGVSASGGITQTGGIASGGIVQTGGIASGGIVQTGGIASGGIVQTGGTASGGIVQTGGIASGGIVQTGGSAIPDAAIPGTGGVINPTQDSGVGTVACPASTPASGTPCAGGGVCSWGTEPRIECRVSGQCVAGAWQIKPRPTYCTTPLPAECPTVAVSGKCGDTALECLLTPETLCRCIPCNCTPGPPGPACAQCMDEPMGTPVWFCDTAPRLVDPCPATIPNQGSACDTPGRSCPSSACNKQIAQCKDGTWQWVLSSMCPVCASPDTPIATPTGDRPIADLREGDLVFSVEGDMILAVPLLRVGRTPVRNHHVVRVRLSGGHTLEISGGHPTADGRTFAALRTGDRLDGAVIESVELIPYRHPFTYDILPASSTGDYFANGLRIGSTLTQPTAD